jgi:hypothetical protein
MASGAEGQFMAPTARSEGLRLWSTTVVGQELDVTLREALVHGHGLEVTTAAIETMFQTMPKNMYGRVGRDGMRYMVYRYYGEHFGWTINGFDAYYLKGRDSTVALARGNFQDIILTYMLIYGFQAKRRNHREGGAWVP